MSFSSSGHFRQSHNTTRQWSPSSSGTVRPGLTSPLASMPSPRSSPTMRPTSPLSPGYQASAHYDGLQAPSQQQRPTLHPRTSTGHQRRSQVSSMKLPSLPRFHPANFPSAHSSLQTTPDGVSSPQPPVSPRAHQRMYSDAQKQLYLYQREMLSAAVRASSSGQAGKPVSPRLQPLGSPGPVTPLELEGDGYLLAGARNAISSSTAPEDFVEQLVREETRRQQRTSPTQRSSTGR